MPRRMRRWLTGTGRWVRPSRGSTALVAAWVVVVAAGAGFVGVELLRSDPPARTLAGVASLLAEPPTLESALEVTWTHSVEDTPESTDRWLDLVAPGLPPGLCVPAGEGAGTSGGGLAAALQRLDRAVRKDGPRDEIEEALLAVRSAGDGTPGGRSGFLARYGLARGYAAAGDHATAAEVLAPVFDGWLSEERVPDTNAGRARRAVAEGRVSRGLATDAFLARYLAGTVAYHRGEADLAVAWFRRAINVVNYLLAWEAREGVAPRGHHQRVVAGLGDSACPGSPEPPTSLDAYAGLVAAYMAHPAFRDPGGLPGEVARGRLEMDPDDPFAAVLRHAAVTEGDPARTPVPENLLWAASNLQRVYHHNRLRPDPRLEVTRSVLLLHLTGRPEWAEALRRVGGADVCAMLEGVARDLHGDAAAMVLDSRDRFARADSARAAVAVQSFARLERDCPRTELPALDRRVRSAWVRLGGGYLVGGLAGRYEAVRIELADALASRGLSRAALERRLDPMLARVEGQMELLRSGRIPGDLPADLDREAARSLVTGWWRALWDEAAGALLVRARDPEPGAAIRAGRVPDYLDALFSATRHAGRRPEELWAAAELDGLARTQGTAAWLDYRVRYLARSHPGSTSVVLVVAAGLAAFLGLLVHVSWWRFGLTVRQRFWRDEARRRRARTA